jgi:hypothetical protein
MPRHDEVTDVLPNQALHEYVIANPYCSLMRTSRRMFVHFTITTKGRSYCSSFPSDNKASLLESTRRGSSGLQSAMRRVSVRVTAISIHIMDSSYCSGTPYRCLTAVSGRRFDSHRSSRCPAIIGMVAFRMPLHICVSVQAHMIAQKTLYRAIDI